MAHLDLQGLPACVHTTAVAVSPAAAAAAVAAAVRTAE